MINQNEIELNYVKYIIVIWKTSDSNRYISTIIYLSYRYNWVQL